VVHKKLTWKGLSVLDERTGGKYAREHQDNVQKWIHEGSLKPVMDVKRGMENAAEALIQLFEGKNVGKAVLEIRSL
jgi:NADPH-dependent curcumin reductase CurA